MVGRDQDVAHTSSAKVYEGAHRGADMFGGTVICGPRRWMTVGGWRITYPMRCYWVELDGKVVYLPENLIQTPKGVAYILMRL